jgi:putative thioredoxin
MAEIDFSKPQAEEPNLVPALSISVDEVSISEYLALSDSLPLLVVFVAINEPESDQLVESLEEVVVNAAGKLLLLKVDPAISPKLAQAFDLKSIPAVYGLLKGQPAPLFVGNQPKEQVQKVIERVLEVAKENALSGLVKVDARLSEPAPVLSENHQKAFDAIDQGEYQLALSHYERALLEKPNDTLAEAGIAQVKLLQRLEGRDIQSVLSTQAHDSEALELRADALIATGQTVEGFETLLGVFADATKEDRETIRLKLVELFLVVGTDSDEVKEARKKLSLLLF